MSFWQSPDLTARKRSNVIRKGQESNAVMQSRVRNTYTEEQKASLIAKVKANMAAGMGTKESCIAAGTSDHNFYNWTKAGIGKKKPKSYAGAKLIPLAEAQNTPLTAGRVFVLFGSPAEVAAAVRSLS